MVNVTCPILLIPSGRRENGKTRMLIKPIDTKAMSAVSTFFSSIKTQVAKTARATCRNIFIIITKYTYGAPSPILAEMWSTSEHVTTCWILINSSDFKCVLKSNKNRILKQKQLWQKLIYQQLKSKYKKVTFQQKLFVNPQTECFSGH